jgi:putative transposase
MFNVVSRLSKLVRNLGTIISDCLSLFTNFGRRRLALAAENLFLRKQLALFREREKRALPTTSVDSFVLSTLARWFDWRSALVLVKPATLIDWHRAAFRRFWRWKSRPVGRPRVTAEISGLIRRMAAENPTWGEQRIADELLLKLQIRLSPRTVAKYSKRLPRPRRSRDQRWSTFLRNHPSNRGLRFFHRRDGHLSCHLCVCRARNRIAASDSFQWDRASDSRVDFAAAARSAARA